MKKMITLLCALYGLGHGGAKAQVMEALDVNNVAATFNNTGSLFWDQSMSPQFEAPKGSGIHSIFASAFWIGGKQLLNNGDNLLKVSATRFNQNGKDFNPGPCTFIPHAASQEIKFNRIFKFTCLEIEQFKDFITCQNDPNCDENVQFPGYIIPDDILDYPGNGDTTKGQSFQLGLFEDHDADGLYEPLQGEVPLIKAGDVMLYFIINDSKQNETGGAHMYLDIHVTAYAYNTSGNTALDNTIFVNYRLVNRSQFSYFDNYVGLWTDFDLGNALDDYLGSAPEQNMYFAYNSDSFDQNIGGAIGYEDLLAAQGVVFLGGPKLDEDGSDNLVGFGAGESMNGFGFGDGIVDNERLGMTSFMYYHNSSFGPVGEPETDADYYNMMRARWKDGNDVVYGGTGYPTGCSAPFSCVQTQYMFPGDEDPLGIGTGGVPQTSSWSEASAGNYGGDRRGVGASGPFTFAPGANQELDIAYVFARLSDTTSNPYDAVDLLKQYVASLPALGQLGACQDSLATVVQSKDNDEEDVIVVFPNPSTGDQIFVNSTKNIPLDVYNVLGEKIFSTSLQKGQNQISLDKLSSGLYFFRSATQSIAFVKE